MKLAERLRLLFWGKRLREAEAEGLAARRKLAAMQLERANLRKKLEASCRRVIELEDAAKEELGPEEPGPYPLAAVSDAKEWGQRVDEDTGPILWPKIFGHTEQREESE